MLGVGKLGRQALGVYLGLYLLVPFLLQHCVAFGPRAVEGVQLSLVMFSLLVMAVTVVATVGEGNRGEAQRQGHREQQHYGQLSGQFLTSFLCAFSIQAQAWYPSVGAL